MINKQSVKEGLNPADRRGVFFPIFFQLGELALNVHGHLAYAEKLSSHV